MTEANHVRVYMMWPGPLCVAVIKEQLDTPCAGCV
jgi:hypothetical protein